jgi:tetratricopeptide (TPR) repeat protein
MEREAQDHPNNLTNLFLLGTACLQQQNTNQALQTFDRIVANNSVGVITRGRIAQIFAHMGKLPELENTLQKLAAMSPDQPESRYDLAALQAYLGQTTPALANLKVALDLSAERHKTNPAARNLLA